MSSVAFDESTERLLVRQSGVSSRAAQRSSWHVLVSQLHVSWVTKDAQGRKSPAVDEFGSGTSPSDRNIR